MKTALAVAALALVTNVWAQTPAASSPSAAGAKPASVSMAQRESHVEERISDLHAQLKITKDQEAQWAKVADAMRDNAQTMHGLFEARRNAAASATAVENLKSWGDIAQAHADGNKTLLAAFEPLYGSMPDAQKKIADQVFRHPDTHRPAHKPSTGQK
ncbi:Spy/CpxP family protein refolding chaperone [Paraburkholderia sp. BL10I2N1]|uniref:Spy/CpxP family protein refolding chaperone n=1 Tax=Paraburkholderia sp. BL10I2N1 TaxID=1938796 RepID=UPI00105CCC87|nr:Spy/CpxP family protein refolding chaperone [Paraburkholderia sp. BL10I2N1]TDN63525.1 LTXXQ motif family protein [Paraburkholderia sp. BL10I2N1]